MLSIWRAATVATLAAVSAACVVVPNKMEKDFSGRPECRHDIVDVRHRSPAVSAIQEFAGDKLNVPEFHDCQQLIEIDHADRSLRYGMLAAVVAPGDSGGPAHSDPAGDVRPESDSGETIAMVHTPDFETTTHPREYGSLGIRAFANHCVVVAGDAAWMVPWERADACPRSFGRRDYEQGRKLDLEKLEPVPGQEAYPAAARWEYDTNLAIHLIGARCDGSSWCIVGERISIPRPNSPGSIPSNVYAAEGFFDEQPLAEAHEPSNGPARLLPSTNTGRVYPTRIANVADTSYAGQWIHSATVTMSDTSTHYQNMGFVPGEVGATIELCQSTDTLPCKPGGIFRRFKEDHCKSENQEWYARVKSPGKFFAKYHCVKYRGHVPGIGTGAPNSGGPAMARWRWLPDDETIWIRCHYGCCEVAVLPSQTAQ